MTISNLKSLVDSLYPGGKTETAYWLKTTGAVAYTDGVYYDLSMLAGTPRPNVYPGSMGDATLLDCTTCPVRKTSIYHGRHLAGMVDTKHILTQQVQCAISTGVPSVFTLCDYLMFYPLIDLDDDSRQDLTNANQSLTRYTDGKGVRAYLVVTADAGATGSTLWYEYLNQDGVTRNHSCQVDIPASSIVGQIAHSGVFANTHAPFLPLAPGDTGMTKITAIQLSNGMGQGWGCVVMVKPLADIPLMVAGVTSERCYFAQKPSLPRVYPNAYLGYIMYAGGAVAGATTINGSIQFVWGT